MVGIREANLSDARRLWRWANDSETRRWSFDPSPISWDQHVEWLHKVLTDPQRHLLVGYDMYGEVGMVRFDVRAEECEVSITVAPECRGQRMSQGLLDAALSRAPRQRVVAQVLDGNQASMRLFSGWIETSRENGVISLVTVLA